MDLGRLGVHEEGLDLVPVAAEQGVGEGTVAPVDPRTMEVDEQPCHRVQQSVARRARAGGHAHEQATVLDGVRQVLGHEDRRVALRGGRQSDRRDRWKAQTLEVPEDIELGGRDAQRFLLERVGPSIADHEAHEMARGTHRQVAEAHGPKAPIRRVRPGLEGALPGQVQEFCGALAQAQTRERRGGQGSRRTVWLRGLGQSRFRRYAATLASYPTASYRWRASGRW